MCSTRENEREADGCFVADSLGAALSWERGGREGAQRARGDVRGRNHNRNNVGIKQGHLRHLQIGEAIPTGLLYGQIPQALPRSPPPRGAPLSSCAVMRAGWGKKQGEPGTGMWLQGRDVAVVLETWWDGCTTGRLGTRGGAPVLCEGPAPSSAWGRVRSWMRV